MACTGTIDHRNRAIGLALAAIDASPGEYLHVIPRRDMLQGLIDQHSLRDVFRPGTIFEEEKDLTIERYENILRQVCSGSTNKFYRNGSKALGRDSLKKIGYSNTAGQGPSGAATKSKGAAKSSQGSKAATAASKSAAHSQQTAPRPQESPGVIDDDSEEVSSSASDWEQENAAPKGSKRKRTETASTSTADSRPLKIPREATVAPTPSPLSPPPESFASSRTEENSIQLASKKRSRDDIGPDDGTAEPPYKSPRLAPETNKPAHTSRSSSQAAQVEKPAAQQKRKRSDEDEQVAITASPESKRARGNQPDPAAVGAQSHNVVDLGSESTGASTGEASVNGSESAAGASTDVLAAAGKNTTTTSNDGASTGGLAAKAKTGTVSNTAGAAPGGLAGTGARGSTTAPAKKYPVPHGRPTTKGPKVIDIPAPGENAIQEAIKGSWLNCQEFDAWIREGTKLDGKAEAEWLQDPKPELESLFVTLFGKRWRRAVREMNDAGKSKACHVAQMLPAAAVYQYVWEKPLPWTSAKERAAMFAGQEHFWNEALKKHNYDEDIRIETIAWRATGRMMLDDQFRDETIKPIARSLAEKTFNIIKPQLSALGVGEVVTDKAPGPREFWRDVLRLLRDAFFKALVLKGLLDCSPHYYSVQWVESGGAFDRKTMKAFDPHMEGTEVAWCVAPMVTSKPTKDSPEMLVAKATIFPIRKLQY